MLLQDVIDDIHALYEDLKVYERKYGILSETFYELYTSGAEPDDEDSVLDWSDWAGAYKLLIRRQEQYRHAIQPGNRGIDRGRVLLGCLQPGQAAGNKGTPLIFLYSVHPI